MRNLVIILLILQPLINKITLKSGVSFDVYNELLSILVFSLFAFQVLIKAKISSISLLFFTLVGYMVAVVVLKGLGLLGLVQIAIYCQWFFFFLYFYSLSVEQKTKTLISFKKILDYVLVFIVLLAFIEIPFYEQFREFLGLKNYNRGIGGFYLVSFFGSGASLANFMSLYIIFWFYYHYGLNVAKASKDKVLITLAFLVLILSFSRKEVLFLFLFLLFFPFQYRSKMVKWGKKLVVFVGIFTGLFIYYLAFFSKANEVAFGDKYVRWKIAEKSYEVLSDNLPFGTGPGTFGSRISLINREIYEKYEVGQQILGYKVLNQTRGPIYDAFLFTFTTEMGIGILIFFFFFFKIFEARTVNHNKFKGYIKNFVIVYLLGLSFFQPVLVSSFSYLCAIFLATSTGTISIQKFRLKYAKT